MAENKARESQASDGPASEEFVGFANAPVNEDGSHVDFREVPAYDAEADEAVLQPSSIQKFRSNDTSTDGSPSAVVPAPDADVEADADQVEDEAPDDPATVIEKSKRETPNASPAEGEEAPQS